MKRAVALLLVVGLAQIAADAIARIAARCGAPAVARAGEALRGVAAATAASPNPKVFGAVEGFETFSNRFFVEWQEADGARSVEVTPQRYGGLRGPYLRRNVYGAALAYGPVLDARDATRPLFRDVARHALSGDAPLLRELAIDAGARLGPIALRWECVTTHPFALRIELP